MNAWSGEFPRVTLTSVGAVIYCLLKCKKDGNKLDKGAGGMPSPRFGTEMLSSQSAQRAQKDC